MWIQQKCRSLAGDQTLFNDTVTPCSLEWVPKRKPYFSEASRRSGERRIMVVYSLLITRWLKTWSLTWQMARTEASTTSTRQSPNASTLHYNVSSSLCASSYLHSHCTRMAARSLAVDTTDDNILRCLHKRTLRSSTWQITCHCQRNCYAFSDINDYNSCPL